MSIISKLLLSKEIKAMDQVLVEAGNKFNQEAFSSIKSIIHEAISAEPNQFKNAIRVSKSLHQYVYTLIANIAGDEVESGRHHLYRGVLNPLGLGKEYLHIYKSCLNELVSLNAIDNVQAEEELNALLQNIKTVG